jgi:tRNA G18 (ribose-2'-O)-methylase SpoU
MSASINTSAQNLTDYKWKNRILLVFGNEKNEELLEKQQAIFNAQKSELAERELMVFVNPESDSMAKLRKEKGFEVILIGKDGGVKKRKTALITTDELFGIIDSMPMRQSEMRGKN